MTAPGETHASLLQAIERIRGGCSGNKRRAACVRLAFS
jgi:hypothetical protein